ncbi:tRNA hydroxylase [Legionella rubrilucens]|uniref:tRNA hydroxylase n=1 Tax=Legionella rubrilucens TaxID=458 RepID=A0A0W0Y7E3_9GAMM|nr:tRNA-(ms[2]io[6]A)-hydroxylase [Legionella rubrilucens]KTD52451.1 tRNA hydroxylase [Legionella rubrilucens]
MLNPLPDDLQILIDFLKTPTPKAWIDAAISHIPLLLLDHAHCERKAAATAINFMSKYPENKALVAMMSPLAREELLHFEKVIDLMTARGLAFGPLHPSAYAQQLHALVIRRDGKQRLCEQLLVGAIIEARSCERFNALIPSLEDKVLQKFYQSLVKSEARHFENYLTLASDCGVDFSARLAEFIQRENELIMQQDTVFRFHSGIPCF